MTTTSEKIEKLRALARDKCNPHVSKLAAAKVRELLDKLGDKPDDLPYSKWPKQAPKVEFDWVGYCIFYGTALILILIGVLHGHSTGN